MAGSRQNEGEEMVVALWLRQGRTNRSKPTGMCGGEINPDKKVPRPHIPAGGDCSR